MITDAVVVLADSNNEIIEIVTTSVDNDTEAGVLSLLAPLTFRYPQRDPMNLAQRMPLPPLTIRFMLPVVELSMRDAPAPGQNIQVGAGIIAQLAAEEAE